MNQQYEFQYLYLEYELSPKMIKEEGSPNEEKRVEVIQVFGEEE